MKKSDIYGLLTRNEESTGKINSVIIARINIGPGTRNRIKTLHYLHFNTLDYYFLV